MVDEDRLNPILKPGLYLTRELPGVARVRKTDE